MSALAAPIAAARRAVRHPLAWVLVAAAAVRVAFHLQVRGEPTYTSPLWDAVVFDEMARNIAAGRGCGLERAYFFGPLYGYALGLLYAVTGACTACVMVLQHALGLVLGGLTYKLARRWFTPAESTVAAALLLLSGVQVFFEGKLLMEVLVSTLLVTSLLVLTGERAATRPWRQFTAGLLLGLAATGRPSLLALAPLAWFPLAGALPARRKLLAALAVFAAGVMAAPTVTLVRNWRSEGAPVLVTASGGYNLYLGNGRDARALAAVATDLSWNGERLAEEALGRDLDSVAVSRYWQEKALREMGARPLAAAGAFLKKAWLYLGGFDVAQIEWYGYERERWTVLGRATMNQHLLSAAALAGLALLWPRRRELGLLYGALLLLAAGTAIFFVLTRYRVVALPYLAIFAAAFLVAAARAVRARERRLGGALLVLAVLAGAATAPALQPVDRGRMLMFQLLREGLQYTRAGLFDEAVGVLVRARDLDPADWEPHLNLGVAYRERGEPGASLASLQAALTCRGFEATVPYQLGVTLHALGRSPEAEQALRQSLEMDPGQGAALTYLGLVHATQGRLVEARSEMERGLALDAAQPQAWNNLGVLRGGSGDLAGARAAFERAIAVDAACLPARVNLAKWHLDHGDRAAAQRELRRVLAENPAHAEAAALLREAGAAR